MSQGSVVESETACPSCGAGIHAGDKFCASCGKAVAGGSGAAPAIKGPVPQVDAQTRRTAKAMEGQRRQVTVMFTDMQGYTATSEKLGEDGVYHLMQMVFEEMVGTVHANKGTVQELTGDGLMALFGAPVALEDAPVRACRAGLEILERIAALGDKAEAQFGVRPKFRIGIHTGPLVVGSIGDDMRMEFTALGDTVNYASRLESLAEIGTVYISDATRELVEGYVEAADLGEREVKGKAEPQRVHRLEGLKSGVTRFDVSVSRGLTPLVGRDSELEALEARWEEAKAGHMRLVGISGEAGIGKSRLTHEFRNRLDKNSVVVLQGHCLSDGQSTAFLPFVEVVRRSFGLGERTDRVEIERKLRNGLEILSIEPEKAVPYLMLLLGLQGEAEKVRYTDAAVAGARIRDALYELMRARCRVSPTVLLVDDLHWIDSASEDLLEEFSKASGDLPLLILSTQRPEYKSPWGDEAFASEIKLQQLSARGTADLISARLGTTDLPQELTRLVTEKAEGNPLYAEEITAYLLSRGDLRRDGGVVTYQSSGETGLPVTLENLVLDRFDRLDDRPRGFLEAASVVGRRFELDLMDRVLGLGGGTAAQDVVDELQGSELVFADERNGFYQFKHAVVRAAVYDSLLKPRQAELHERVADAIVQSRGDGVGEAADTVADHYGHTPRAEKAVHYMALAGEQSLAVYSLEEAELRFRQVLELIDKVPGCADDAFHADVLLKLARILYYGAQFFELIRTLEPHLDTVESLGDPKRLSRFLFELGYAHCFSANQKVGTPLLERALAIGEEAGDEESIGYACMGLMWPLVCWTEPSEESLKEMKRLSGRAIAAAHAIGDVWLETKAHFGLVNHLNYLGRPVPARQISLKLLDLSQDTGDPRPRALGLDGLAWSQLTGLEYDAARETAGEAIRISIAPIDKAIGQAMLSMPLITLGHLSEGLGMLQDYVTAQTRSGMAIGRITADPMVGVGMVLCGDLGRGIGAIKETERLHAGWGSPFARSIRDGLLGEIYLQMVVGERPPMAVMLRNFWFLARTLPVAARRAQNHLEAALEWGRAHDSPATIAANLTNLGLLHQSKKRTDRANACFAEAREIAEANEMPELVKKIDAALSD